MCLKTKYGLISNCCLTDQKEKNGVGDQGVASQEIEPHVSVPKNEHGFQVTKGGVIFTHLFCLVLSIIHHYTTVL